MTRAIWFFLILADVIDILFFMTHFRMKYQISSGLIGFFNYLLYRIIQRF